MHFADGQVPREYIGYVHFKIGFMCLAFIGLALGLAFSISIGAAGVPFSDVVKTLVGISVSKRFDIIVWNIRMPQALTAVVAGAGLSVAGATMQSISSQSPWIAVYLGHIASCGIRCSLFGNDFGLRRDAKHKSRIGFDLKSLPDNNYCLRFQHASSRSHYRNIKSAWNHTGSDGAYRGSLRSAVHCRDHAFAVFCRRRAACSHGILDLR